MEKRSPNRQYICFLWSERLGPDIIWETPKRRLNRIPFCRELNSMGVENNSIYVR